MLLYYGKVRYLYIIFDRKHNAMQEVRKAILQDVQIAAKPSSIASSVSPVECYVCGKGIQDGCSITARTLKNGIVLFCDVHYLMQ